MADLQFYRQQTSAQPSARPNIGAIGQLGRNAQRTTELVADAGMRVDDAIQKRAEDEAAIDASAQVSQARRQWTERTIALQNEALEKGTLDGYAGRVMQEFDAFAAEASRQGKTPQAQAWIGERYASMGADMYARSAAFEADAKVKRDVSLVGRSLEDARVLVDMDPDQYSQARDDLMLQYSRLPAEHRAALWDEADRKLAYQAALAGARDDPSGALDDLDSDSAPDYVKRLDADSRIRIRSYAETEVRQREAEMRAAQSENRAIVQQRAQDHVAMSFDGQPVQQPLTRQDFAAAGMPDEYDGYQRALQMAPDMQSLQTMPASEMREFLASSRPDPAVETDYADRLRQYEALTKVAGSILKARNDDPIAFVADRGLMQVGPLDMNDPTAFGVELRNRAVVASAVSNDYGSPFALFSENEASALGQMMQEMTAVERGEQLAAIRASLDDRAYSAALQQIAPGAPIVAMAGSMMAADAEIETASGGLFSSPQTLPAKDIAARVLKGDELLAPPKTSGLKAFPMPSDTDMRLTWAGYTGSAYRGDAAQNDRAYQAYRAYYAAETAALGQFDGEFNETVAAQAARAVSGGVAEVGASDIVLPWGLDEATTIDRLNGHWTRARESAGLDPSIELDNVELVTMANGEYMVVSGASPFRGADGRPIVLDAKREVRPRELPPPEVRDTAGDVPTPVLPAEDVPGPELWGDTRSGQIDRGPQ